MSDSVAWGPPAITVDVEDWLQSTWDRSAEIGPWSADSTLHLLDVLNSVDVRATMFVLGKFAERFPKVVRRMNDDGHEVACHGHGHLEIFTQSRADFVEDVAGAKSTLEQITGRRVQGYRAPDFSVVRNTLWALEALADLGFDYDSSIFPVRRARYGIPDWPAAPVSVALPDGRRIVEFPIGAVRLLGRNWPVGGGGYHRLLPGWLARSLVGRALRKSPFVYYCHPYEFQPQEFGKLPVAIPFGVRLHQGLGRSRFQARFEGFVRRFRGQRLADLLATQTWPTYSLPGQTRSE